MADSNDPTPLPTDHPAEGGLEQTLLTPAGAEPESPRLVIEVLTGGRLGLVKECFEQELSLGRSPTNGLPFDSKEDRAVSGKHLRLCVRDGSWWAEDLNSTNGTLLNGEVLDEPRALASGDELELGRKPGMGTGGTVKLQVKVQWPASPVETKDDLSAPPTRLHVDDPEAGKPDEEPALPASSIGERLAALQARTMDLGKLTYRLEEQLSTLATQAMETDGLELADLPGGPKFLEGRAAQTRWAQDCAQARNALEGHAAAAAAELQNLDERCANLAADLERSQATGAEARDSVAQAAQQETSLQAETRQCLVPLLADLNQALASATFPKDAPLSSWLEALKQAATELDSRREALGESAAEALASAELALSAEAAIAAASSAASEAASQLQSAEADQAQALGKLKERLEQLESEPQAQPDHEQAQLRTFAAQNLVGDPSALAQLPAFEQATQLEQQRTTLAAEIELLQAGLQ